MELARLHLENGSAKRIIHGQCFNASLHLNSGFVKMNSDVAGCLLLLCMRRESCPDCKTGEDETWLFSQPIATI